MAETISRRVMAAKAEILSIWGNRDLGPKQTNEAIEAVLVALEADLQNDGIVWYWIDNA